MLIRWNKNDYFDRFTYNQWEYLIRYSNSIYNSNIDNNIYFDCPYNDLFIFVTDITNKSIMKDIKANLDFIKEEQEWIYNKMDEMLKKIK